jgi:hypothetical protein
LKKNVALNANPGHVKHCNGGGNFLGVPEKPTENGLYSPLVRETVIIPNRLLGRVAKSKTIITPSVVRFRLLRHAFGPNSKGKTANNFLNNPFCVAKVFERNRNPRDNRNRLYLSQTKGQDSGAFIRGRPSDISITSLLSNAATNDSIRCKTEKLERPSAVIPGLDAKASVGARKASNVREGGKQCLFKDSVHSATEATGFVIVNKQKLTFANKVVANKENGHENSGSVSVMQQND